MFVNHMSGKGLVSRKCEELLKLGGKNRVFRAGVEDEDSEKRGQRQVSTRQDAEHQTEKHQCAPCPQPAFRQSSDSER